jgi:hypothetical protein
MISLYYYFLCSSQGYLYLINGNYGYSFIFIIEYFIWKITLLKLILIFNNFNNFFYLGLNKKYFFLVINSFLFYIFDRIY